MGNNSLRMLILCDPTEISDYSNHIKNKFLSKTVFFVKIIKFFCVSKSLKRIVHTLRIHKYRYHGIYNNKFHDAKMLKKNY